ncbi:LysR family transcriptional regulator [Rhodococcus ruber]|uniref:LysR family transcriptional regulator n=1 Tax=Rhodococcus TaxID=1827 RepID=UPI00066175B7|nr:MULTISPECIES: LysR family transcriptional regulator [Rhodococcus]AXY53344.1 LysR family transcriptional regulator [Rhodococcus ruber]UQB71580.1 LysR family transcriptional regulator [Rhodococcus ruber]WML61401.1 LysR family transcriptional regulator [Rhodococcus sp. AH-ZY2]
MRIEQLEYIAAVTAHGSLRRASEAMNISQPALSEAITRLEKELGTTLLDRRRTGSRISREGLELLQNMTDVIEAVGRLRQAAGDQGVRMREIRIGTVNTASSTLLVPALLDLRVRHGSGGVEVINAQQSEIHQGLAEGTLDLGLINVLPGDDVPTGLVSTELIHGQPVACLRNDHPLAAGDQVTVAQLRDEAFVAMRPGYVMHRFAHRLFAGTMPTMTYATDGAEMGKAMVAEGLGISILPDYSVCADPLVRAGVITTRPIRGDDTTVSLLMLRRKAEHVPSQLCDFQVALMRHAGAYRSAR